MKKGKLLVVTLLASSLLLSACNIVFPDENGQEQQTGTLSKIAISKEPNKLIYEVNETLDTTGLEVIATYTNNSTKDVTSSVSIGQVDMSTIGQKDVSVSYGENGSYVSTSFKITVNQYYTISFDANGGSGSMESQKVAKNSSYTLPQCAFVAPDNKMFKAWQVGISEYSIGDSITVNSDLTIKALWKDKPHLDSWTIMLYISGNDLESGNDGYGHYNTSEAGYATQDITEILNVSGQPNDVNIIIETGGAGKWRSTYGISNSKLGRYYVENKQLKQDPTNASLGDASMGAKATFQSFLEWGLTNYPAEKVGVILWNHGGALEGVCYDENHKSGQSEDRLTDDEVVSALSGAFTKLARTEKLEFIGYDACLMQVQDIAEFNSPFFNYMVGSQESEAGEGWNYSSWIDDLYSKKPTTTILSAICDGFIDAFDTNYPLYDNDQTSSVLDLSKISVYKTAFELLANEIKTKYNSSSSNQNAFENILKNVKCYADTYCDAEDYELYTEDYGYPTSWFSPTEYSDYPYLLHGYHLYGTFDVTDFLNKLEANSVYKTCSALSSTKAALSELIIKNSKGNEAGESYGLCMMCPMNAYTDYKSSYTHFTTWRSLVFYRSAID